MERKSHMTGNKTKREGTNIEIVLRKALTRKGYVFETNAKDLPGSPDIVLRDEKIAVFCDGDFFHGKNIEEEEEKLRRGRNGDYWIEKIRKTTARDRRNDQELRFMEWKVLRFWGSEILADAEECVKAIEEAVFERKMEQFF